LSSNQLTNLDPNVFAKSPNLRKLCLNYNNLSIPEDTSLLNQPALEELNLVGCNIEQLYESSFANLTGLLKLQLSKNPLDEVSVDLCLSLFKHVIFYIFINRI
jgi:Leucine-rich repeat (LRR) protein